MPGLGSIAFSRGRRLLSLLEKRKEKVSPEESPLPTDAEEPTSWFLQLLKGSARQGTDSNNNSNVQPTNSIGRNQENSYNVQDKGSQSNQQTKFINQGRDEKPAEADSYSKDLSPNPKEFKALDAGLSSNHCKSFQVENNTFHKTLPSLSTASLTPSSTIDIDRRDNLLQSIPTSERDHYQMRESKGNLPTDAALPLPTLPSVPEACGTSAALKVLQQSTAGGVVRKLDFKDAPSPAVDCKVANNTAVSPVMDSSLACTNLNELALASDNLNKGDRKSSAELAETLLPSTSELTDLPKDALISDGCTSIEERASDNRITEKNHFVNEIINLEGPSPSPVSAAAPQYMEILNQAARTRPYVRGETTKGINETQIPPETLSLSDSQSADFPQDALVSGTANSIGENSSDKMKVQENFLNEIVVSESTSFDSFNDSTADPFRVEDNTTMILDAGSLDLGEIFSNVGEDLGVTIDLPIINAADIHMNTEEIAQDNPVIEEATPKQVTRKRTRNPTQHKAAKAKRALYAGEAHVNKKGDFRPAPTMRPPCVCKFKCSTKITEEERLTIFKVYNCTLGCKDKQWAYVRAHSSAIPVTKTTTDHDTPRRKVSRKYFLDVRRENGEVKNVRVCKLMFMNTLAIWDGVIDSAYQHINQVTKTPTPDKRGKHSTRPKKTTEEQRESVKTHINSYPRIPSHYVRSRIQREYVENGLTAAKMHRQYKVWCVSQAISEKNRATLSQYRHILNYEFNIGFFRPKKDKCQLCALMKNGTRQEREHFKKAWVSHFNSKKACYAEQKKARELVSKREECAMLSFDLQKVLPCPKSETSVFFYKNKLSLYNLTVYESRGHIGTCYLWHEGIAKRGANEIGSCLMKALVHQAQQGKKEIFTFSDSCSGQNKNRFIYGMMLQVSAIYGVKIRHCFLTPGHTYNDADSVHARIENATKGKEIYDFGEWIKEIENSKQNGPAYKVVQMKSNDFFDLKELISKQNWKTNTDGHVVKWNKVRIIETDGNRLSVLAYQYEVDGSKYYLDTNQRRGHPVNLKTFKPKVAYNANVPLKSKTIDHLRSLCQSLAIPSKYHPFYENIFENVQPTEEDEELDAQVLEDSHDPEEILDEDGSLEKNMANDREESEEDKEDEGDEANDTSENDEDDF